MLDERFITAVIIFILKITCRLGLHSWDRSDGKEHVALAKTVWYDSISIEFFKCENCGKEKMVWWDNWGGRHVKRIKK